MCIENMKYNGYLQAFQMVIYNLISCYVINL